MAFLVSTVDQDVVIQDLGGRTLIHPTTDLDLEIEYTSIELNRSKNLFAAITAGHLTAKDSFGQPITSPILAGDILAHINDVTAPHGKVEYFDFDTIFGVPSDVEGRFGWDPEVKSMVVRSGDGVALNVGQEEWLRVYNDTGSTIPNGSVIRITGSSGEFPTIELCNASDQTKDDSQGVATQDIPNGSTGLITIRGFVNGIDTSAWTEGTILYMAETNGALTNVKPRTVVEIAIVVISDATNGRIYVDNQFKSFRPNFVFIEKLADFPTPISGNINLKDNTIYYIIKQVNIGTNSIVMGENSALIGDDALLDMIVYTGTGTAIKATDVDFVIKSVSIVATTGTAFNFIDNTASKNSIISRAIISAKVIGSVTGYSFSTFDFVRITNMYSGITFNSINVLQIHRLQAINGNQVGGSFVTLGASTFGAVQMAASYFGPKGTAPNNEIALNISASATVGDGIVVGNHFVTQGNAVALAGINSSNIYWEFQSNVGIQNSQATAEVHATRNTTETTIPTVSTPVKPTATYLASNLYRFTHVNGVLTYIGRRNVLVIVSYTTTITSSSNNQNVSIYIAKNGTAISTSESSFTKTAGQDKRGVTTNQIVSLTTGDTISPRIENNTGTSSLTTVDIHFSIAGTT